MQQEVTYNLDITDLSEFLAKKAGVDLFGVGDVSCGLADELKHMPMAISLAVSNTDILRSYQGLNYYFYQQERIDKILENAQRLLINFFKRHGYLSLAIPPDSYKMDERFVAKLFPLFPHKTASTCAGLGWIGKNGLLINKKHGPCLGWATVLTNAPLRVTGEPCNEGKCGRCRSCVDSCPVGAIKDKEWHKSEINGFHIDIDLCMKHLDENRKLYGQAICGQCVINCARCRKI